MNETEINAYSVKLTEEFKSVGFTEQQTKALVKAFTDIKFNLSSKKSRS